MGFTRALEFRGPLTAQGGDPVSYERDWQRVGRFRRPYLASVERVFRQPGHLAEFDRVDALSPEDRFFRRRVRIRTDSCLGLPDLADRGPCLEVVIEDMARLGPDLAIPYPFAWLADTRLAEGRPLEAARLNLQAVEIAERLGNLNFAAFRLGQAGSLYGLAGKPDSLSHCWRRFHELGIRGRMPFHQSRYYEFETARLIRQGRCGDAVRSLQAALDLVREAEPEVEARFHLAQVALHLMLGFPDLAGRELERIEYLIERQATLQRQGPRALLGRYRFERALWLLAVDDDSAFEAVGEARRTLAEEGLAYPDMPIEIRWVAGLVRAGRVAEARSALHDLERAGETDHPDLRLARAWVDLKRGNEEAARAALAGFREGAIEGPGYIRAWDFHDAVLAETYFAEGREDSAGARLAAGLDRLQRLARRLDGSAWSAALLDGCRAQRDLLARRLADDPALGYRAELAWRGLPRLLGGGRPEEPDPLADCRALLDEESGIPPLRLPPGVVHCVFYRGSEGWIRWTAEGSRVTRDVFPPGPPPGLPERVLRGPPGELWITGDDILDHVGADVRTLMQSASAGWDPCLVRGFGADVPVGEGGLLVVSPDAPDSLRRRHQGLPPLAAAEGEAAVVRARLGPSRVLAHGAASERAIRATWEGMGFLYFLGHAIRDEEYPYLVGLVTAGDAGDDGLLSLEEIRAEDLRGTGLVVLSGCATAVGYGHGEGGVGGLADAFLDAGARHVLATLREVRDEEAARFMEGFLHEEAALGDPVRALAELHRRRRAAGLAGGDAFVVAARVVVDESGGLTRR